MSVFIVIPARNEERTIPEIVIQAKRFGTVVVVDDGSDDNTSGIAEKAGAIVLHHIVNIGKGGALKTGCDFALMHGADRIVAIDADAQHDPRQIPAFLSSLETHDIVFGYRTFSKNMPRVLQFGNSFINLVASLLYHVSLHDTQCGYRAFTAAAYKKLRWTAHDYSVESEMVSNTGKKKLCYAQVPIKTIYLDNYKGTTVLDGIKIVMKMLWWKVTG
ncbi:glycosyltransferase family 2 protein [Candidatus Woesearchaeota archaeon]|nr:glycosyltransferase family 2 protein [Candidatus Woesearchaeota archaeon]